MNPETVKRTVRLILPASSGALAHFRRTSIPFNLIRFLDQREPDNQLVGFESTMISLLPTFFSVYSVYF